MASNDAQTANMVWELPIEVWFEIFQFATYVHRFTTVAPMDPFTPQGLSYNAMGTNTPILSMRTKYRLALVCRAWKILATELLYEYIDIRSPRLAALIHRTLLNTFENGDGNSGYGKWVRHIEVQTHVRGSETIEHFQLLFNIFKHCQNLRMLTGFWGHFMPESFVDGLLRMYGPTLKGLRWEGNCGSERFHEFLGSFQSLRVLDLRNPLQLPALPSPKFVLPCLEDLQISTRLCSIDYITSADLPSLHRVLFECDRNLSVTLRSAITSFLAAHGGKIKSLELVTSRPMPHIITVTRFLQRDACPNLVDLTFDVSEVVIEMPPQHLSLRRIGLRGVRRLTQTEVTNHLKWFNLSNFPALEVVRTISYHPSSDVHPCAEDDFVRWTEFFEKDGVEFQDGEGFSRFEPVYEEDEVDQT